MTIEKQLLKIPLKYSLKDIDQSCPNCGSTGIQVFYETKGVPAHSVLLMSSKEAAITYPRGNIELGFCGVCGFMFNTVFDPGLHEYSSKYEETQGFSPTFNAFHRRLAKQLIDQYHLHDKDVIEIGCGKGEFLSLLCEIGNNRGVGIDPAFIDERNPSSARTQVTFIKDFYSEKYADYKGDFVCCKMTLEHIPNTEDFVSMVHRSLADKTDTVVFFQIPNTRRILKDNGFWDIYYEHCSYFADVSLTYLFQNCGFEVLKVWTDYDDQYLMIEARPGAGGIQTVLPNREQLQRLADEVDLFTSSVEKKTASLKEKLSLWKDHKKKVVIWGGGSKGVAFLTKLGINSEIEFAVDINPYKKGTFMAGSGQQIVSPTFLEDYNPDVVIVMNPVYVKEIDDSLRNMGLAPELLALE